MHKILNVTSSKPAQAGKNLIFQLKKDKKDKLIVIGTLYTKYIS